MYKSSIAAMLLTGAALTQPVPAATAASCNGVACGRLVFFGTHGSTIIAARLDERTGLLTGLGPVVTLARPTWLVARRDRPIVYAVSETGNDGKSQAKVYSLKADPATGQLTILSEVASGGGGATHLAFDSRTSTLFVANYGTGHVASIPVSADGRFGQAVSVRQDYGSGPSPRQAGPHAHGVAVAPGGGFVLVTDLGADRIFVYRVEHKTHALAAGDPPFTDAATGSGPRHAVFVPRSPFVYVISELTGDITGYRWDGKAGQLHALSTRSTQSGGYQGPRSAAEIVASSDGRFVYVSNRGENCLVAYRVDAVTGALAEVQRIDAGGKSPWSFGIDLTGRWLLVTNEASSNVTVFSVDRSKGSLSATGQSLVVSQPVSVAFLSR